MRPYLKVTVAVLALAAPAAAADPWRLLEETRQRLQKQGPQQWTFTQSYLPAGFDRGEEETGRVALDLPRCVRWDYDQPYPKSYLLCGEQLWAWNPGERVGHLYEIDEAQPGLDLLMLAVPELTARYTARAQAVGGATRVHLAPKSAGPGTLRDAAILVDRDGRLRELTYRDAEGNRTTFRFAATKPLPGTGSFSPPREVRWERQSAG